MKLRYLLPPICLIAGFLLGYYFGQKPKQPTAMPLSSIQSENESTVALKIKPESNATIESTDKSSTPDERSVTADTAIENGPSLQLDSAQVSARLVQLEEEQDLVGILQVLFSLIEQGRFAEADALIEFTIDGLNGGKLNSPLWKGAANVETMLLRHLQQNYHSSLKYVVYLTQMQNLPELLSDLREEVLTGSLGTLLIGLNDGSADNLVADLVPYYREKIENWDRSQFSNRDIIKSLGFIATEESALLLADLKDWAPSNMKLSLIQSLATNGTPVAIDFMNSWLQEERNPRFKLALEDALRLLQ